jgi:hypothetical protein
MAPRQPLSPEEEQKSYSKYYYMETPAPDPALIDSAISKPLDPADALKMSDINDLLKPGYLASERGYCFFPDGSGYVSVLTQMPGATVEMMDWWFAWHPLHPLRYKLWNPDDHFDLQINETDRKRLTDSSIPVRERNWGCTHLVTEDCSLPGSPGAGARTFPIRFNSPAEAGFDISRFNGSATAICSTRETGGMVHFARKTPAGIELRTRFWFPPNMPEMMLTGLTAHNIKEFGRLAVLLPQIFAEESGKTE